jgi:hypothetical protein
LQDQRARSCRNCSWYSSIKPRRRKWVATGKD